MHSPNTLRRRLFRALMLSALTFWVAGGGCLLGCESTSASAASHHAVEASHTSQPSSGDGHECCRMKKTRAAAGNRAPTALKSLPRPHGLMTCYALAGQMSETVHSLRIVQASTTAQPVGVPPRLDTADYERPERRGTRVPDRGGTHLRCCVFLI